MRKKIFAFILATLMVATFVPTTAFGVEYAEEFLYVDGKYMAAEGGAIEDSEGEGWSYSNGTLVLDGYSGGPIVMDGIPTKRELNIELRGSNTVEMTAITDDRLMGMVGQRLGIFIYSGTINFTGNGTLQITGNEDTLFAPIMAHSGYIDFALGEGGKVRIDTQLNPENEFPGGIQAFQSDVIFYGTIDRITLQEGNFIERPEGGTIAVWELPMSSMKTMNDDEKTTPVPTTKNAPNPDIPTNPSYTTVVDGDGNPARNVTISGPIPSPQEVTPAEVEAKPAGTVTKTKTPKTGDESMAFAAVAMMIAGGAACVGLRKRI